MQPRQTIVSMRMTLVLPLCPLVLPPVMEVVWAVAMGYSDGFTVWYYDVIVVVFLIISMYLLEKALRTGIPVGTAYAVWTGIGAVGTITVSVLLGNESVTLLRVFFVILIIAGITGLQLTSGSGRTDT